MCRKQQENQTGPLLLALTYVFFNIYIYILISCNYYQLFHNFTHRLFDQLSRCCPG